MTKLKNKIKEAVSSVLPITCIVFLLSITITPMPVGTMLLFACGAVMLIIGMGLFPGGYVHDANGERASAPCSARQKKDVLWYASPLSSALS